jgi:hypothetical protein
MRTPLIKPSPQLRRSARLDVGESLDPEMVTAKAETNNAKKLKSTISSVRTAHLSGVNPTILAFGENSPTFLEKIGCRARVLERLGKQAK